MNKLFLITSLIFILLGCSFIPRVSFDRPNTVPQTTEKFEKKERCNGEVSYNDNGKVISCTKGYSLNEKHFNQKERKLTLKEKILNFFANLKGWFFWGVIGLVFFTPGLIGVIIGNIFNASHRALEATIRAISRAKKNGGKYMEELDKEHGKSRSVQKKINAVRAKIKK